MPDMKDIVTDDMVKNALRSDTVSGLYHDRPQRHYDILPRSFYRSAGPPGIVTT